jgi:hypothetical protein
MSDPSPPITIMLLDPTLREASGPYLSFNSRNLRRDALLREMNCIKGLTEHIYLLVSFGAHCQG